MSQTPLIEIKNLTASIEGTPILKGINLKIMPGESHAIMGRNGAGKSTLSNVIIGNPDYQVDSGDILFNGQSILDMPVEDRARAGIFLSFQYPVALPGIKTTNFLRTVLQTLNDGKPVPVKEFRADLRKYMELLNMDDSFLGRYVNDGFSGGEKKRMEMLQFAMMKPKFAILDETDSGLDIDALRTVAEGISKIKQPETGILVITHYHRILKYHQPDYVHVMVDGKIIKSGDKSLALELEEKGYDPILTEMGVAG